MGNDQSQMSGVVLEEKAVEVTDFWSHHSAVLNAGNTKISVFIGEPLVGGSLWVSQTPLEKASKNLMLHRHPCILRYVSSWSKGSKYHLAVEDVKPLSHVLQSQSVLQICIGLHSILKALVFLHETAQASHNNVCTASIYVTRDGSWKLGGLEYLCKFKEMTSEYMNKARAHRYDKAVDPGEDAHLQSKCGTCDFIDIYAFGVLVSEVFKHEKPNSDDSVQLQQFLEMCKHNLQHVDITKRPKLASLLKDGFFNHDFIIIHSFLVELPLKSDQDKDAFFISLIERLRTFQPALVAKQLGGLLLSRMLLLNKTAQANVIPKLLAFKERQEDALFDNATFREYIVPKLLEIFCVRDAQIRLLLLEHFSNFTACFTNDQLQNSILPELLLGIKDTNDHLVAVTLRSLADLIPILGSTVVIGGNRAKLFNDGLPIVHKSTMIAIKRRSENASSTVRPGNTNSESDILSNTSSTETHVDLLSIERPSPDGEEGDTSTLTDEGVDDNQLDAGASPVNEAWDDWDINDSEPNDTVLTDSLQPISVPVNDTNMVVQPTHVEMENTVSNSQLPDILELDIKNMKNSNRRSEEFDFFQDMEPVINTTNKFLITETNETERQKAQEKEVASKFDWSVNTSTQELEEGWGDDLDGWDQ